MIRDAGRIPCSATRSTTSCGGSHDYAVTMAVPIIPARDTSAGAEWYRDKLGFDVVHVEPEYAIVERDRVGFTSGALVASRRGLEHDVPIRSTASTSFTSTAAS